MKKIVIIGASAAGHTLAVQLKKSGGQYSPVLVTEGSYPFYDKPRLLEYLRGDLKEKDLLLVGPDFYESTGITFFKERKVVSVSPSKRVVHCRYRDKRETLEYDDLVICSGRRTIVPDIEGSTKEGVYKLDTLNDCRELKGRLISDPVCLIGGGARALAVARKLAGGQREIKVITPEPLEKGEDIPGLDIVRSRVVELIGESGVQAVRLQEGKIIGTSLPVIISQETRANADFLKDSGIAMSGDYLTVDERMRTSIEHIFASGSVCRKDGAPESEKARDEVIQESLRLAEFLVQAMGG